MIKIINRFSESNKALLYNTLTAFSVRGLGLIVSLFTIPAYMNYFSDQKVLGLWFTMLSLLNWVLTFDLGLGNGLRNRLIKPFADKDMNSAKIYISSTYLITISIVVSALTLGLIAFPTINWNRVFNISDSIVSQNILYRSIMILFSGVLLQFVLKIVYSILYALQKSAIPNVLSLSSNILLLVFVLVADKGTVDSNLIMLSKANLIFTNLPLLVATLIIFMTKLKPCTPDIKYFSKTHAYDVLKLGVTFFWLQLMSLVLTSTNEFLISWLASPEFVVEYQIYFKLFSLVGTIFTLAMTPIWSAVTKAHYENNFEWIKKLFRLLKYTAFVFAFLEFLLIFLLQFIVDLWLTDNSITIDYSTAVIFAISGSLYIWHSAITSIVNGTGKLRVQFIFLTIGGAINIPVAYLLFLATGSWTAIVMANIVSLLPYCVIQPIYIKKYLNFERSRINESI